MVCLLSSQGSGKVEGDRVRKQVEGDEGNTKERSDANKRTKR